MTKPSEVFGDIASSQFDEIDKEAEYGVGYIPPWARDKGQKDLIIHVDAYVQWSRPNVPGIKNLIFRFDGEEDIVIPRKILIAFLKYVVKGAGS